MVCSNHEPPCPRKIPSHWSKEGKDRFFSQVRDCYWEDPYFFKDCPYQVVGKCILESEIHSILTFCYFYTCGGHFGGCRTSAKVLHSGFFWPTMFYDVHCFCLACKCYQHTGALFHCDMMPLSPIQIVKIFNV